MHFLTLNADAQGLFKLLLIHAGPTEFIYYWLHRALHLHSLYARYGAPHRERDSERMRENLAPDDDYLAYCKPGLYA